MDSKKYKWYIVQVVPGAEEKVKENLENIEFENSDNVIKEIFTPYVFSKTKTNKIKKTTMFPGYIYATINMSDENWFLIRNTDLVTGIVGSSGQRIKPTPISEIEIEKIKLKEKKLLDKTIKEIKSKDKNKNKISKELGINKIILEEDLDFKIGDKVEILEGEFQYKKGTLKSIDLTEQTVTLDVEFFGRIVEIEVEITKIKK